jgi:hypothetical protein
MELKVLTTIKIDNLIIRDVIFVPNTHLIIFGGSDKTLYFYNYKTQA